MAKQKHNKHEIKYLSQRELIRFTEFVSHWIFSNDADGQVSNRQITGHVAGYKMIMAANHLNHPTLELRTVPTNIVLGYMGPNYTSPLTKEEERLRVFYHKVRDGLLAQYDFANPGKRLAALKESRRLLKKSRHH